MTILVNTAAVRRAVHPAGQRFFRTLARGWDRLDRIGLSAHQRRVAVAKAAAQAEWDGWAPGGPVAANQHWVVVGDKLVATTAAPRPLRGRHVALETRFRPARRYGRGLVAAGMAAPPVTYAVAAAYVLLVLS